MTFSEVTDDESRRAYFNEKRRQFYARNRELISRKRSAARAAAKRIGLPEPVAEDKSASQPATSAPPILVRFGRFLAYSKMNVEDLRFLLARYELLKSFLTHQIELIKQELESQAAARQ